MHSSRGSGPRPPRRPPRRGGGRRQSALTVDAIVAAAIEVLDEGGVAGLTMRRVAERLETGPASLYAHVSGRDELLELVFDALVGQVHLPPLDPAHWRDQAHAMLVDLRDILAAHSDAALAGLGRVPTSPQTMAAAESLTAVLRAGGFSDPAIALGLDLLILFVSAAAYESSVRRDMVPPAELERYFLEVHAFYGALPTDAFPTLTSIAPELVGHDADERFHFGVDVILDGLAARPAPAARRSGRPNH